MQNLTTGPLAEKVIQTGGELWLDGGHNPHAARAIANTMAELEARVSRPLILITGILANKDIEGFLEAYEGLTKTLIGVPIPGHESLDLNRLTGLANQRAMTGYIAKNITDALDIALESVTSERANPTPRILICGSLYLAGEVLKLSAKP